MSRVGPQQAVRRDGLVGGGGMIWQAWDGVTATPASDWPWMFTPPVEINAFRSLLARPGPGPGQGQVGAIESSRVCTIASRQACSMVRSSRWRCHCREKRNRLRARFRHRAPSIAQHHRASEGASLPLPWPLPWPGERSVPPIIGVAGGTPARTQRQRPTAVTRAGRTATGPARRTDGVDVRFRGRSYEM